MAQVRIGTLSRRGQGQWLQGTCEDCEWRVLKTKAGMDGTVECQKAKAGGRQADKLEAGGKDVGR